MDLLRINKRPQWFEEKVCKNFFLICKFSYSKNGICVDGLGIFFKLLLCLFSDRDKIQLNK